MPKITIDGRGYEVEDGQNVLAACLSLGLDLPYFCWHPAMGSVGACRQCAVIELKDSEDTRGRLVMGCMTPVRDGGIYSINAEPAREFRGGVIENLMTNHPHDCPVCEEGGECHLQDMTEMSGHTHRRFNNRKRTHRNQDLGPFINHEMNRCIACYRCVRFYRDYAGGEDLEVLGRNNQVYFGRQQEGKLENGFSGNLVEVCPTGVFTDRTFSNHYTRKWDLQTAPSICEHCGVGCNTAPGARADTTGRGENLRRVSNLYNPDINGYFLCDRGRFGYEYVYADNRLKQVLNVRSEALIESTAAAGDKLHREVDPQRAVSHLAQSISESLRGRRRLIGIGSPRTSLENNFALRQLVGAENFYAGLSARDIELVQLVDRIQRDPRIYVPNTPEIEAADTVIILGEDIANTAPRIGLAVRQAARATQREQAQALKIPLWQDASVRQLQGHESQIYIASPTTTGLDDVAAARWLATPANIIQLIETLIAALHGSSTASALPPEIKQLADTIATALKHSRHPVIVSGCGSANTEILQAAGKLATVIADRQGYPCATYLACPEVNTLGLMQCFDDTPVPLETLSTLLNDRAPDTAPVTLLVLENDLFRRAASPVIDALFEQADESILIDSLYHASARRADWIFPSAAVPESEGTVVNSAGLLQRHYAVYEGEGFIQESWRWLVDAAAYVELAGSGNQQEKRIDIMRQWQHCHQLSDAVSAEIPSLQHVGAIGPDETFRIDGLKIARQTHRASGRTALHADQHVKEERPLTDYDAPMSFSMEGIQQAGATPLQANIWSPGWNSNQALHKFIDGADGPREGTARPCHLVRTPEPMSSPTKMSNGNPLNLQVAPIYQLLGSGELSNAASAIAGLCESPFVLFNREDADRCGIAAGDLVSFTLHTHTYQLEAQTGEPIAPGVVGIPCGLPEIETLTSQMFGACEIERVEPSSQVMSRETPSAGEHI